MKNLASKMSLFPFHIARHTRPQLRLRLPSCVESILHRVIANELVFFLFLFRDFFGRFLFGCLFSSCFFLCRFLRCFLFCGFLLSLFLTRLCCFGCNPIECFFETYVFDIGIFRNCCVDFAMLNIRAISPFKNCNRLSVFRVFS